MTRQHQPTPNTVITPNPLSSQIGNPGIIYPAYYGQTSQVNPSTIFNGDPRMAKLVHAHRVGMKAMETMGNRNHDDTRGYAKFSQVCWRFYLYFCFRLTYKLRNCFFLCVYKINFLIV